MTPPPQRGPVGLKVIGVFKAVSSLLLFVAGFGVLRLVNKDLGEVLSRAAARWRLDPGNHLIHEAISRVSGIDRKHLKAIGFGTFFYAALYLVEGIGLILGRRWASYLTVVATGSLVPFEVYEVYKKETAVRVAVLLVNLAIVAYLVVQLRRERRAQPEPVAEPADRD